MPLDLKRGIVRILAADGATTSGTGFILSEKGIIVTCSHVVQAEKLQVRGYPRPERVEIVFRANGENAVARLLPQAWRAADGEDVAFLQLDGPLPDGVEPLPLGSSEGCAGHQFQSFGFPDQSPEEGLYGEGQLIEQTSILGMKVWQVKSSEITPGFSGGPVYDRDARRVVGMVTSIAAPDKFGRLSETAFVTPAETLFSIYPAIVASDVRPYMGLAAFTEKDAEFFFGRRKLVEGLEEALQARPRFLLVMGPSGSGKSSLVQAGLMPRLRKGSVPGSDRWGIIVARPADRPFENLEAKDLEGAAKSLVEAARQWLQKKAGVERMLLVLDQLEEFLVTCPSPLRMQFWAGLRDLLNSDLPVIIMPVMRDDFYSRFAQEAPSEVIEWISRGVFPVSASLEPEDLQEIIEQPACQVGLTLEEGLTQVIINDVLESCREDDGKAGRSTALPLLEFALTQVWERRDQGFLTHKAYQSVGKVAGSLTAWADEVCRSLEKNGLGQLTRRIFTDLVNLGDETQRLPDSRRRRLLDDLCHQQTDRDSVHRIVQRLADARLVTTSTDKGQVTVEIIHDSLIREWSRLQRWLKKDRAFLSWQRELEKDAREWRDTGEASGRDEGRLLRGLRLGEALRWINERKSDLNKAEIEFVQASVELREREKEREEKARAEKERTRRRIIKGLAVFSVFAILLSGFAFFQMKHANEKTKESLALYLASQSEQLSGTTISSLNNKILLAVESLKQSETWQGDLALRHGLALPAPPLILEHNNSVNIVIFSPDDKIAATASSDNTTRLWNVSNGKELHRLHHNGSVWSVVFSPDGLTMATASDYKTARLWEVSSGQELRRLHHNDSVWSVAFSPDGRMLATGSYDYTARLWDVDSGIELHRLPHDAEVLSVAFSPDGDMLATNSYDYTARLWDVDSGIELHRLPHDTEVFSVAFSPDGDMLATGSDDYAARLWDVDSGIKLYELPHDNSVGSVAFSPDGSKLATESYYLAHIWDVDSGKELHELPHDNYVESVAFSPDGSKLATTSEGKTPAHLWDVASGRELFKLPAVGSITFATFSHDGKKVATASGGRWNSDDTARIWDISGEPMLNVMSHDSPVYNVAFSPDGLMVATTGMDVYGKKFYLWNSSKIDNEPPNNALNSKQFMRSGVHEVKPLTDALWVYYDYNFIAFSPDNKTIAVADNHNTTKLINRTVLFNKTWRLGVEFHELHHNGPINFIAFSPDGNTVATASSDNTTVLWDTSSGKELHRLSHNGSVLSVAFSPDGRTVATASKDKTARLWDAASGLELRRLRHNETVDFAEFSPNGKMVATASNLIILWDVASGKELKWLPFFTLGNPNFSFGPDSKIVAIGFGEYAYLYDVSKGQPLYFLPHEGYVISLAFSPDGKTVATSSSDKSVRLWDVASGREIRQLPHGDLVWSVAFSPDGKAIATASIDKMARIWLISSKDLIKMACSRVTENLTIEEWKLYGLDESTCMTCPYESRFNRSLSARLAGMLTGSGECQPCGGSLG